MNSEKVLLAFSGGLDTSFCVPYLSHEKGLEVHTALVNTGGFSVTETSAIAQKAHELGACTHTTLEETQAFYDNVVKYLIFGNVLKNKTYPLSVSAERTCQAIALSRHAKAIGAAYIAHGSTGAGNDQVRFDLTFQLLVPDVKVITPIRDLQLTRKAEVDYLTDRGFDWDWKQAKYSINQGLWGTSVGGKETLTSNQPLPEDAFPSKVQTNTPKKVKISFLKGQIISLNDKEVDAVKGIQKLNEWGGSYAIGRDIHVGDTIIGIKGRVGFEAPAAQLLIAAHHALEKHVLSKWQLYWKDQLANWYGMFIHEAQYFDPVMRDIEKFLENSQHMVTGDVWLELWPYRFNVLGVASNHDLMSADFGAYGELNKAWSGDDVKGFTKIMGNAMHTYHHVNGSSWVK